jgi:putative ABC transport system permease protein
MLEALRIRGALYTAITTTEWLQSGHVIRVDGDVVQGRVALVEMSYFATFGLRPLLGRSFEMVDVDRAAVLTANMWRDHFPGRRLSEARITVGTTTYDIVGVLPEGVRHPLSRGVVLLADSISGAQRTNESTVVPFVRVRAKTDSSTLARELGLAARHIQESGSNRLAEYALHSVRADPFSLQPIHGALAGGAITVLLVSCANVANLLLARGLSRRRDLAVRIALGATRGTLAREIALEALLLSVAGAAVGAILTAWSSVALEGAVPRSLGLGTGVILEPQVSWRVFVFALAAAVLSSLVFGTSPAVRLSQVDPGESLKESSGGVVGGRQFRFNGIVVVQVATALAISFGACLLIRSVALLDSHNAAGASRGLIRGSVNAWNRVGREWVDATPPTWQVLERLRGAEDITSVTVEAEGCPWGSVVLAEGGGRALVPGCLRVSHDYMAVRSLAVLDGREFSPGDATAAGSAVIDTGLARQLWGEGLAVGRYLKLGMGHWSAERAGSTGPPGGWMRVVGTTERAGAFDPRDPEAPDRALILVAEPVERLPAKFLIRTSESARAVATRLEYLMSSQLSGDLVLTEFEAVAAAFEDFRVGRRFVGRAFLLLGALTLCLAVVGLLAVLSQAISGRTREFAVRIALGATPRDIVGLGMRDALAMILLGTVIGWAATFWVGRLVEPWLYHAGPMDAVALVAAEAVVLSATTGVALVVACRALRVSPACIIRSN